MVDAALGYAARGWRVLPLHEAPGGVCTCAAGAACSSPGKHPRGDLVLHGVDDATTDAATIRRWWRRYPTANIGIACGGGLLVIDVDGLAALAELERLLPSLPATLRVSSGRAGGVHVYLACDTDLPCRTIAPGVELKSAGKYVVAPASVHYTGRVYTPHDGADAATAELGAAPVADLLALLEPPRPAPARVAPAVVRGNGASPYGAAGLERECGAVRGTAEGGRHDQLIRSAFNVGQLVAGGELAYDAAAAELQAAALACGLGEAEAERTIADGIAAGSEQPRTAPERERPARTATATYPPQHAEPGSNGAGQEARPAHSWLASPLPETEPLAPEIAGLFVPGLVHEVYGGSESGKTMLLLCAAWDEARAGAHVVWIDFEMGHRQMRQRLEGIGVPGEEIERLANDPATRRFHYVRPDAPALAVQLADLLASAPGVRLVVLDAFTGVLTTYGRDSNSDVDVAGVYAELVKPFRELGAAVVMIDHPGKDPERGTRGSIRKEQEVDLRYEVRVGGSAYVRGVGGASRLSVKKDRPAVLDRSAERRFVLTAPTWRFEEKPRAAGEWRPTTLMERVSLWLEEHGESSRTAVRDGQVARDAVVDAALDELVRAGFAEEREGPRRARLARSVRPYRQADDPASDRYAGGGVGGAS